MRTVYTLYEEPNWIYEATIAVLRRQEDPVQSLIDNAEDFGMQAPQMAEMLDEVRRFSQQVREEIEEIVERKSTLLPFIEPLFSEENAEGKGESVARMLVLSLPEKDWSELDEREMQALVARMADMALTDEVGRPLTEEEQGRVIPMLYDAQGWTDAAKLILIRFFSGAPAYIQEIYDFLHEAGEVLRRHQDIVSGAVRALHQWLSGPENMEALIRQLPLGEVDLPYPTRVYISPLGFNGVSITAQDAQQETLPGHVDIFVGIHALELLKRHERHTRDDVQPWKLIADQTRWRMLQLLCRGALYPSELAERLSVTPATISHHLNVMVSNAMVLVHMEASERVQRPRYSASPQQLRRLAKRLTDLAEEAEHEEE